MTESLSRSANGWPESSRQPADPAEFTVAHVDSLSGSSSAESASAPSPGLSFDDAETERILVVGNGHQGQDLVNRIRARYADCTVCSVPGFLPAVVDVSRRPTRAILAFMTPPVSRIVQAVSGLRSSAGPRTRLVLCVSPDREPVARAALDAGADDYLLLPIRPEELDVALDRLRPEPPVAPPSPAATSVEELARLSEAASRWFGSTRSLLELLAGAARIGLGARAVRLSFRDLTVVTPAAFDQPILVAPLGTEDKPLGYLQLSEPEGAPYSTEVGPRLRGYALLITRFLAAAASHRQWRTRALTDECTGLPNRRYLNERFEGILHRASAERFPVTVLLFDIDDFKAYNDRFGHDAGDEILRDIGLLFRQHCREQDIVCRYGGDEFAVVFWDPEGSRVAGSVHPHCALNVLDRFKSALQAHRFSKLGPGGVGQLTISGGLATFPWNAATGDALFHHADQALLAAKRAGKNRILLIGP